MFEGDDALLYDGCRRLLARAARQEGFVVMSCQVESLHTLYNSGLLVGTGEGAEQEDGGKQHHECLEEWRPLPEVEAADSDDGYAHGHGHGCQPDVERLQLQDLLQLAV